MNDDTVKSEAKNQKQRTHPERIELEYVVRKYSVSVARAQELVALFGDDESLIAAELALKEG